MDLNDWGALGGCKGLGKLDLNTQLLRVPTEWNDLDPDVEAYHLLFAHESSHWVRYHSSTIGISLSLMKYASERLIRDFVFALDEKERRALMRAKKEKSNFFGFQASFPSASEELSKTRQFWLDLRYAYKALLDSEGIEDQEWDTVPAIASAFTDVNFWARQIFAETRGIDHIQLDGSRGIPLITVDDDRITTRLLFECAATIDQYTSWLGGIPATPKDDYGRRLLSEAERALGGSYGAPLRAYEGITGVGRDRLSESAFNVSLLIDLALNPKIPPFMDAGDVGPLHWEQIYPPFRYVVSRV
ncbi:hypothetical protein ACQP2X_47960 [Actinoplanes sp. CA-131856]